MEIWGDRLQHDLLGAGLMGLGLGLGLGLEFVRDRVRHTTRRAGQRLMDLAREIVSQP